MDDVDKYLRKYQDFNNASAEEQANTIRAIHTRLSEIQKANGDMETKDTTTIT
jgi:hypothetical protein